MSLRLCSLFTLVTCLSLAGPVLGQPFGQSERIPGGALVEPSTDANGLAEKAAFIAQYDDGAADFTSRTPDTTFEVAMLFNGVGGPDVTLGGVDFCWRQDGGDPKVRYEVVIWAANGPGGSPGTELAKFAAVATGVTGTPAFYSTNFNYPLTTSNVYIGVRYNPVVDPGFWWCVDDDGLGGAPAQPAFFRGNEVGSWNPLSSFAGLAGYKALMVRGFISTPGVFAENLLVPYFLVDKTDPAGTTTLFAVRNLTGTPVFGDIEYFTTGGASQRVDDLDLGPFDTVTVNLRDIPGLATGMDGFARGYVEITTAGNPDMTPVLGGDYFQVDVGDNFATGDQLARQIELCNHASIRALEFPLPGSGTRLTIWIANPRGVGTGDPPSFTVQAYDEAGNAIGGLTTVKTTLHALEFDASVFTGLSFSTLRFNFTNSFGGTVYAEASVEGRFSVGVTSQCDEIP